MNSCPGSFRSTSMVWPGCAPPEFSSTANNANRPAAGIFRKSASFDEVGFQDVSIYARALTGVNHMETIPRQILPSRSDLAESLGWVFVRADFLPSWHGCWAARGDVGRDHGPAGLFRLRHPAGDGPADDHALYRSELRRRFRRHEGARPAGHSL